MSTTAHKRGRPFLVTGLVLACLLALLPGPADAAQGSGPTTWLTGITDTAPAPPVYAQEGCLPAGGSDIADPELPDGDFVLVGGGWGHGAGMSQYGAQGAGRLGCSAAQILTTYFPGTAVETRPQPDEVVLGVATEVRSTTVTAQADGVPYELCHYTSGACTDLPTQPSGATWTLHVNADASYRITDGGGAEVWAGGDFEHNLRAILSPDPSTNRRLHVSTSGHAYRWGVLQLDSVQTASSTAFLTLEVPDMDLYLRGLAEVPASWPATTLQAQAISGRSYALARITALGIRDACRCHLYTTPRDQNYEGWDHEAADAGIGGAWVAAVNATSGQILSHQGTIAETFYSSSHGGHSESSEFVFGGALPYVQPVDDSRWDLASSNPLRRWTEALSASELGSIAGVGTATSLELLSPRGADGRVGHTSRGWGGARVTGTDGTVTWTGDQLKSRLGLRSTLVHVRINNGEPVDGAPDPEPEPTPTPEPTEPSEPPPSGNDVLARVAASDRIGTAVEASQHGWDASEHVVIAAADRFPDALAGVALAASLEAPLLLSATAELSSATAAEVQRLGASTAWLLGGSAALSSDVRGDLASMEVDTRRLFGENRFETAAAIAVAAASAADEVILVPAGDWPDAVSASSLSALVGGPPILLVGPDHVDDATVQALRDLGPSRVTLVGGTAVIGESVAEELGTLGYDVRRLSGRTRFETTVAVAGEALQVRGGDAALVVASGGGFADALSAGALAARLGGVLVLAPSGTLTDAPPVQDFVDDNATRLPSGAIVGGTAAISTSVEAALEQLLDR